jgi:hypothetical protein
VRLRFDASLIIVKRGPQLVRPFVVGNAVERGGAFLKPGQKNEEDLRSHPKTLETRFVQVD